MHIPERKYSSRRTWFIVLGVLAMLAVGYQAYLLVNGYDSLALRIWLRGSWFGRVHAGMTKKRVEAILGRPLKVVRNNHHVSWSYHVRKPGDDTLDAMANARLQNSATVYFGLDHRVSEVRPYDPSMRIPCARNVRPGMTEEQVRKLAGKPMLIEESPVFEEWLYPETNHTHHAVWFGPDGKVYRIVATYRQLTGPNDFSAVVDRRK